MSEVSFVSLSTEVYGAESSLLALCQNMPARVFAPAGDFLDLVRSAGVPSREIHDPAVLALRSIGVERRPRQVLGRIRRAARGLQSLDLWRGGVVSFSQWLNPSLALAARRRGVPVVLDMHDGPFTRIGRAVQLASVRLSDGAIFVSETTRQAVLGRSSLHRRSAVVHRPVEVHSAPAAARSTDGSRPLDVVYAGRLDAEKRVDLLLDVSGRLRDRVRVTVVGEATHAGRSAAMLAEAYPHVRFLGRRSRTDTLDVIAASDVLVSPARGEAFGRTVYEAALLGLASVVDSSADAARAVTHGSSGWVLGDERPWSMLGSLLVDLESDRQLVREVGTEARSVLGPLVDSDHVRARYWEVVSDFFASSGHHR